jgi:phosphatidylglycerol:prolipoprotein diacylglycerol transferase
VHPDLVRIGLPGGERVVHSYGALLVLGCATALALTAARARQLEPHPIARFDAFAAGLFAIIGGLVGATLLYIVVHWREMLANPAELLQPGLVFYGGLAGGFAGAATYCRIYMIPLVGFADCAVPGLALGHALGRVGCFLAGCCYGRPAAARFPLAVLLAGVPRHPVQLYEAAGLLLLGLVLVTLPPRRPGQPLTLYLIGYAVLRLFTESLRGDDEARGFVIPGLVSTSQALALAVLLAVLVVRYRQRRAAN